MSDSPTTNPGMATVPNVIVNYTLTNPPITSQIRLTNRYTLSGEFRGEIMYIRKAI